MHILAEQGKIKDQILFSGPTVEAAERACPRAVFYF